MSIRDRATDFAIRKHCGTTRKFGNTPYVAHPIAVAARLAELGFETDVVVAAVLHDTVEDTDATLDEIKSEFGARVAELVSEVTSDESAIAAIDSSNAKGEYLAEKMRGMSPGALAIKLADREDNVSDLSTSSTERKEFSSRYARSTQYIMDNIRSFSTPQEKTFHESIRDKIRPFL